MRTWMRGAVLLVVTFAVGGAIGFELGRAGRPSPMRAGVDPMEPHAFVARLGRDLDLDTSQRAAILQILTRRQTTIDSAWRALRPSVRATIDSAQSEIVSVLHPDQRTRYIELSRAAHGTMMDGSGRSGPAAGRSGGP